MRRCTVLLLLAAMIVLPSVARADVQTINFRCIFQYCHDRFYALAGVTMYDPTTADWTLEGGVGILDADEFTIISLVLANPSAPNHNAIHSAFLQNSARARTVIGSTIIGLTTSSATSGATARQLIPGSSPAAYYAADGLMGAYLTLGEWATYDTTMAGFKDSPFGAAVLWTVDTGLNDDKKTEYDLSCATLTSMCGDEDGDSVKNCNEFWATGSYASAIDVAATTGAVVWNAWACLEGASVRFVYNEDTDRVYVTSPAEITWDEALAYTIQYPGGASLPVTLVTIRNAAENEYVRTLANGNTVWIGASDAGNDTGDTGGDAGNNKTHWYWLSSPETNMIPGGPEPGPGQDYTNWNAGEPNGVNGGEDCGTMRDDGTWNDVGKMEGTPAVPRTYYAVFETTGTWPDADNNHAPDAFEDVDPVDLIPDAFGVPQPIADFEADDTVVDMGTTVNFTDKSSGNGETLTAWAWDFNGDGVTDSTLQNPSYTYETALDPQSTYTVSLTVTSVNNPPDDVRTNTKTIANYITVKYVCPFKNQLGDKGVALAANLLGSTPLSAAMKTALTDLGQTSWPLFDIEGIDANFIAKAGVAGDGLPDAAQMALMEAVVCNPLSWAYTVTFEGMNTNKDLFLDDVAALVVGNPALADFALYGDLFAALIGSSQEMKDTVNAIFVNLGAALPSYDDYVVFNNAKLGDLFSASGDLDGDLLTNLEEYEQVMDVGGSIDTFVDAAQDPGNFWDGNPMLPVAGILGLGLLAGSLLAGAALSIRKK